MLENGAIESITCKQTPPGLSPGFEAFIRERQYLANVTPATLEWYRRCFKWLPNDSPTMADLKDVVIRMREKGLTAAGCNCVLRCVNAYLRWSESPLRVPRLREPSTVPATFTEAQVRLLVTYRPTTVYERRLHLLVLFLLDTGARITEALTVTVADCDLENMLVTLDGKGRKQRVVPISFELRRAVVRYGVKDGLLFATMGTMAGRQLARRNVRRDVINLCHKLGFNPPGRTIHAFRHTFAVNYLRRGGSVFHLQKVLGHSTLEMTRRYANLVTTDLSAVHERVSLLSTTNKKGTPTTRYGQ